MAAACAAAIGLSAGSAKVFMTLAASYFDAIDCTERRITK